MIIAIDGYVATGKGTTAQGVAEELGFTYVDTGAMYRAVAWYAREHDLLDADDKTLSGLLDDIVLEFRIDDRTGRNHMYINGVDKEDAIRSTALALVMRPVVVCRPLREKMVILQRAMGKMNDIVADGRDMGTVVFPNADYKFFLTCDLETRVVRRMRQLTIQGLEVDEDAIRREIILRDETDYLGPDAINKKSPDAQIIDTTSLTISDQVAVIMNTIRIN